MAVESSSTTSRPNDDRSVIFFGGFTLDRQRSETERDDGVIVSQIEWFSIDVPDADSHCQKQKQKLNPLSVMEIENQCYFAALDSSIYCISSHHFRDRVQIFDLTGGDINGWQPGPPPIVSRVNPHKFVVNGKLYILGGVREVKSPWMEVLDPKIGVWKPLPNPPVEVDHHSRSVVALLLKPEKAQILVSSFLSGDRPPQFRFLTYNIDDQSWEPLDTPVSVFKLLRGFGFSQTTNTALAEGDTLYWVSFDYFARHELVIHAYNLITDEWFEGFLNTRDEIFGKKELLTEHRPHGLLHLGHSKFCLLLQSTFIPNTNWRLRERDQHIEIPYLYCVIIVVSKISNMDPGKEGFKDLNISVVATHKYPMDRSIDILDAQLLNLTCRDRCSYTSKQKKPKNSQDNSDGESLPFKEQFQPVVPTQQGQTCVPSASQQFQPMVQGSPSNVAMPTNLSQPRVPPITNHVSGLPNDISAAFATPVLQTGQQPSVIPSTDSAVTVPSLNQHSSSDWQEIRYYYNKRTGESTWDKPPELMAPIEVMVLQVQ
ncbi:uncharacterized protein LOC126705931 isoform X4 [Quercus robur]|uniref:uncharacterized protein LOC126705931 isoform X4 n=1 Tax=Quercus robur TaxID=38942 RepID=UPI0021616EF2|nr:uncharacterized protein LOC126705931 isoform X4 [Quercus robur]